jgi:hypothetical protein
VSTTSASTTFVNALTATITVTASSAPVLAKCVLDMTSATSASVASTRVTINAVAGGTVTESITTATTQHLTVPNQYLSASLGPGNYTVNCDFNRASGTGTVTISAGSLTAVALQGANSNGITQLTGALTAGPGSGSQVLSGVLPVANGGTHLSSTTINQILYSSASNTIAGLATANTGALVTSSGGVPSITSGATANRLLRTNGTTVSFAQAALTTDVSGILPGANGGTGATMFASARIPFSNGTTYAADPLFIYNTATNQFTVGNGAGTGKISSVVLTTDPSPNLIAGNFFSRTTGNVAVEIQNENTLPTLDMTNSGGTAGANMLMEASRGTLAARTQLLTGDTIFSLLGHGRTASAYSAGFGAGMGIVTTENVTDTTNGAEWYFSTTPNGSATPVEHLRIKQSGETTLVNSHLKSTQTGTTTATVNANAGTGATCNVSNATDVAGNVSIAFGTSASAGAQCDINFATAYGVAPICTFTPSNANAANDQGSVHQIYFTSTTAAVTVNFGVQQNSVQTDSWSYHCIETQ